MQCRTWHFIQGKATVWRIQAGVTCFANTTGLIIKVVLQGGTEWFSHAAPQVSTELTALYSKRGINFGKIQMRIYLSAWSLFYQVYM